MRYCETCGAAQSDDAKFCDVCGSKLPELKEPTKSMTLSLIQAVIAYQAGDNNAFQSIYDATEKHVYTNIQKVVGRYANAQVMITDIMQATYLDIARSIQSLEQPEKFVSWADKITTRCCFAYLNANQQNQYWYEVPQGYAEQPVGEFIFPNSVGDDITLQNRIREIIETSFTSMEKLCLVSYYYDGIPVEEMSHSIGVPSQTVMRNLNSAKSKLFYNLRSSSEEQTESLCEAAPWLSEMFKEDEDKNEVPQETRDMIKAAISALLFAAPGAVAAGVIAGGLGKAVTGAGLAGKASAVAGTLGQAAGSTAIGSSAIGGAATGAVGGATAGGAAVGGVAGSTAIGGAAVGATAGSATAAAGTVATSIFATVGAKVAVAIVGAAVIAGGAFAVHHVVTSQDDDDQPAIVQTAQVEDTFVYRIQNNTYDADVYDGVSSFQDFSIEGEKYTALASSVENEINSYKAKIESYVPEYDEWAHNFGYDGAEYDVRFQISRADEKVLSCLVKDSWNIDTDMTFWHTFANFDAQTGKVLSIEDVCDTTELMDLVYAGIDAYLPEIDDYMDYMDITPDQVKNSTLEYIQAHGEQWFLTADGLGFYIPNGYPAGAGCWTLIIPYENFTKFNPNYLPSTGAMAGDYTAGLGIVTIPGEIYIDTDNDGVTETYGYDWTDFDNYRYPYHSFEGNYYVQNEQGQKFLVLPISNNSNPDGVRIYLINTDGVWEEVTNDVAYDVTITAISGDIACCRNLYTNEYMYYQITANGLLPWSLELISHKYEFVPEQLSWEEAQAAAEERGGHLITITSPAEQAYAEAISDNTKCWIGCYCDENHENWQWVTGEPMEYTHWGAGEPNNNGTLPDERYGSLWPKEWNDLANQSVEQYGYIIEWDN